MRYLIRAWTEDARQRFGRRPDSKTAHTTCDLDSRLPQKATFADCTATVSSSCWSRWRLRSELSTMDRDVRDFAASCPAVDDVVVLLWAAETFPVACALVSMGWAVVKIFSHAVSAKCKHRRLADVDTWDRKPALSRRCCTKPIPDRTRKTDAPFSLQYRPRNYFLLIIIFFIKNVIQ